MPYDDIRFSGWDDPDDDDGDMFEYENEYADIEFFGDYELDEGQECNMCGKERSLNDQGYCSQCWTIWNSWGFL